MHGEALNRAVLNNPGEESEEVDVTLIKKNGQIQEIIVSAP
jgi:hypothetical protein